MNYKKFSVKARNKLDCLLTKKKSRRSDLRQKKSDLQYSQNRVKIAKYAMNDLTSISVHDVMYCIAPYPVLNQKNLTVNVMSRFAKTKLRLTLKICTYLKKSKEKLRRSCLQNIEARMILRTSFPKKDYSTCLTEFI